MANKLEFEAVLNDRNVLPALRAMKGAILDIKKSGADLGVYGKSLEGFEKTLGRMAAQVSSPRRGASSRQAP